MVGLLCDKCFILSRKGTIEQLISDGWYWSETTLENGGKIKNALCKRCFPDNKTYFADVLSKINRINHPKSQTKLGVENV